MTRSVSRLVLSLLCFVGALSSLVRADDRYADDFVAERPEEPPILDRPAPGALQPFLGFDYYFQKADVVLSGAMKATDFNDKVQRVLFPKGSLSVGVDGSTVPAQRAKDHILFFAMTQEIGAYLEYLLNYNATSSFSLLTFTNSDYCAPFIYYPTCIDEDFCENANDLLNHPRLKHWFTKSPCMVHPKLIALPQGPQWQFASNIPFSEDVQAVKSIYNRYGSMPLFYFKNFTIPSLQKQINSIRIRKPSKDKLLYFNFEAIGENEPYFFEPHKGLRSKAHDHFTRTLGLKKNAPRLTRDYLKELSEYKFALCPPAKGIDTHCTWEALMVGTIPIVFSSPMDSLFNGMPVLIVKDYLEVTNELLYQSYNVFHADQSFVFDKLYSFYWDDILSSPK